MSRSITRVCVIALVFVGCGGGSDSVTQTQAPNSDSTSAVIGSGGGIIVVPSGAAGVQIPAGVLSQSATVTVSRLSPSTTPGAGPLPTSAKQWPPYYEISVSPANAQLGDFVRIGVCQVSDPSSPFYPPEPTHSRLRLAHQVGSSVEILDRVDVSDFLHCTGVTANGPSTLRNVFALLAPKELYAAHGGLGGKVKSFSPFTGVDPGPNSTPTVIKVSSRATFLLRDPNDRSAEPSVIIDLSLLGFVEGDQIRLERLGDFSFTTTGPENGTTMNAVFSSTNVLLGPESPNRVPGSLKAGTPDFVSTPLINSGTPTDIPDDFFVNAMTVRIPPGARYLFVGTPDPFSGDNVDADGNYAIRVSPVP